MFLSISIIALQILKITKHQILVQGFNSTKCTHIPIVRLTQLEAVITVQIKAYCVLVFPPLFFFLLTFLIKSGISFLSESWFTEEQHSTSKTYPSLWTSPFGDLKRQTEKKNQFLLLTLHIQTSSL